MKLYTTEIQVYDDDFGLYATIKAEDQCAIVELNAQGKCHTEESWKELSALIEMAVQEICKP